MEFLQFAALVLVVLLSLYAGAYATGSGWFQAKGTYLKKFFGNLNDKCEEGEV